MTHHIQIALLPLAAALLLSNGAGRAQQPTPAPAAPGKLIDIGGRRLHLYCIGQGEPTVILEAGLGAYSVDWGLVQPKVGAFTRVCSYDRAGYAWSDKGPEPRGLHTSVSELHLLLEAAGVKPPFVVVGQSWGGRIVRLFAYTYPRDVLGMVLIDTYSEDSAKVSATELASLSTKEEADGDPSVNLPTDFQTAHNWAKRKGRQQDISDPDEPEAAIASTTAKNKTPLAGRPLVVISAGRLSWGAEDRATGKSYENELRSHVQSEAFLATLSRNSRFLIARQSFHLVHLDEPALVIDAICDVVTATRSGKPLRVIGTSRQGRFSGAP